MRAIFDRGRRRSDRVEGSPIEPDVPPRRRGVVGRELDGPKKSWTVRTKGNDEPSRAGRHANGNGHASKRAAL